jgi:hypothetical protein
VYSIILYITTHACQACIMINTKSEVHHGHAYGTSQSAALLPVNLSSFCRPVDLCYSLRKRFPACSRQRDAPSHGRYFGLQTLENSQEIDRPWVLFDLICHACLFECCKTRLDDVEPHLVSRGPRFDKQRDRAEEESLQDVMRSHSIEGSYSRRQCIDFLRFEGSLVRPPTDS